MPLLLSLTRRRFVSPLQEGGYTLVKSKFLVGSTKAQNIQNWGQLTSRLLLHERNKIKRAEDNQLTEGEIRVEITSLKMNKTGQSKIDYLMPPPIGFSAAMGSMGLGSMGLGAMTKTSMSGDVMVLVKLMIPGDPILVSDPVRIRRGPVVMSYRIGLAQRSLHHASAPDEAMRQRATFLASAMASKNPTHSLLKISVILADAEGKEVKDENGNDVELATYEQSLKE